MEYSSFWTHTLKKIIPMAIMIRMSANQVHGDTLGGIIWSMGEAAADLVDLYCNILFSCATWSWSCSHSSFGRNYFPRHHLVAVPMETGKFVVQNTEETFQIFAWACDFDCPRLSKDFCYLSQLLMTSEASSNWKQVSTCFSKHICGMQIGILWISGMVLEAVFLELSLPVDWVCFNIMILATEVWNTYGREFLGGLLIGLWCWGCKTSNGRA